MDSCTSIYLTKFDNLSLIFKWKNCNFDKTFFKCKQLAFEHGNWMIFCSLAVVLQLGVDIAGYYKVELFLGSRRF